jgi:hypothetical protein
MNIRLIIFSGIITAGIGAFLGFAAAEIEKGSFGQPKYQSQVYKDLRNTYYPIIGAGLGLTIGMGQECIRQLKDQRDHQ